jgi:hypothetical protein
MIMERIGLTFDEFVDLKLTPGVGADRAFHEAAEMERRDMFPMALTVASNHLRSRGYDCRPAMLELLVKDGVVTPTAPDAWSQADVDAAAEHFEQCGILTPYAAMCQALGCRYADFLRPLREAAEREDEAARRMAEGIVPGTRTTRIDEMRERAARARMVGQEALAALPTVQKATEDAEREEEAVYERMAKP